MTRFVLVLAALLMFLALCCSIAWSRQALVPGHMQINETLTQEALVPGFVYLNETVAADAVGERRIFLVQ